VERVLSACSRLAANLTARENRYGTIKEISVSNFCARDTLTLTVPNENQPLGSRFWMIAGNLLGELLQNRSVHLAPNIYLLISEFVCNAECRRGVLSLSLSLSCVCVWRGGGWGVGGGEGGTFKRLFHHFQSLAYFEVEIDASNIGKMRRNAMVHQCPPYIAPRETEKSTSDAKTPRPGWATSCHMLQDQIQETLILFSSRAAKDCPGDDPEILRSQKAGSQFSYGRMSDQLRDWERGNVLKGSIQLVTNQGNRTY
jgi:hypothetical protein